MMLPTILLAAVGVVTSATSQPASPKTLANFLGLGNDLAPPVRVEAAGKPVDTATGHAAPFVADFDGDRLPDLLVGQFGEGKLTIYRNIGAAGAPKFASGQVFKDGAELGRVPAG